MDQRNRLSIDYDNMVVPGLVGEKTELTFVGAELQSDLDVLEKEFDRDPVVIRCMGQYDVLGCKGFASRFHFLLPWVEMKKRGIPKFLRTHPKVVAPMCENCYLLYDSKHRKLKTAWVKEAGLVVRKSPSYMRGKYDKSMGILLECTRVSLRVATNFLDKQYLINAANHTVTINAPIGSGGIVTNIDTSELRTKGKITYTRWLSKSYDTETPM